jgi:glycosyltransferase involved in cell wall biosynthesis
MRIVFSSNIAWSIYNFRTPLLKSLQDDGWQIYTLGNKDEYVNKLLSEGFLFEHIDLNNNSTNPFEDLKTIVSYYRIYKRINPDLICHNAIKPNIYGTIAAGLLGIPTVNNISGLGTLFIKQSLSTHLAKWLYKFSQKRATTIFFQNHDDFNLFIDNKLVSPVKCIVIPGSGVNTSKFKPINEPKLTSPFRFLLVARLLYDKGIHEYINAIKILKPKYPEAFFDLLGPLYENNATAISENQLHEWVEEGIVNYLGETDDVKTVMGKAFCVVLPSYREGLSKVLIEASSMGIPIVTTDVPGCKDVVVDKETGFLCKVKNATDLALKMEKMLLLSPSAYSTMSSNARKRAIDVFDEKIIIAHYKEAINQIIKH